MKNFLDIRDLSSLKIPNSVLISCLVLDEELMKCQEKRVFDPIDEFRLIPSSQSIPMGSGKQVFESCDKKFFSKRQKDHSMHWLQWEGVSAHGLFWTSFSLLIYASVIFLRFLCVNILVLLCLLSSLPLENMMRRGDCSQLFLQRDMFMAQASYDAWCPFWVTRLTLKSRLFPSSSWIRGDMKVKNWNFNWKKNSSAGKRQLKSTFKSHTTK